jgi:hypothetical protein
MSLSRAAAAMSVSPNSVDLHEDALDVSKSLVFNSAAALALTACFAFACSVMLSAFSEESVASMARLALALILMSVLAAIVISDALSMVISALAEQDRIAVMSLIA